MESIELFVPKNYEASDSSKYGHESDHGYGYGYGSDIYCGRGSDLFCGYGSGSISGSGPFTFKGTGYGYGSAAGRGKERGTSFCSGSFSNICGCMDILSINKFRVYHIDCVPTIIYSVKGNIAKGAILRDDNLSLQDCYIAKVDSYFAHGISIRKAYFDAQNKAISWMNVEECIDRFLAAHSNYTKKYPFDDLFRWHNILTGSCELGRREWCKERGITKNDSFTVKEFCNLTQDAYGGQTIKKIIKRLDNENTN